MCPLKVSVGKLNLAACQSNSQIPINAKVHSTTVRRRVELVSPSSPTELHAQISVPVPRSDSVRSTRSSLPLRGRRRRAGESK